MGSRASDSDVARQQLEAQEFLQGLQNSSRRQREDSGLYNNSLESSGLGPMAAPQRGFLPSLATPCENNHDLIKIEEHPEADHEAERVPESGRVAPEAQQAVA